MRYLAISVLVLLLGGCDLSDLWNSEPRDPMWVSQVFTGGQQCPYRAYKPPRTKRMLEVVGIRVYDTDVRPAPTCRACICPSYAATHYALIDRRDKEAAQRFGFEPTIHAEREVE
jgi:hypothetical protein